MHLCNGEYKFVLCVENDISGAAPIPTGQFVVTHTSAVAGCHGVACTCPVCCPSKWAANAQAQQRVYIPVKQAGGAFKVNGWVALLLLAALTMSAALNVHLFKHRQIVIQFPVSAPHARGIDIVT